MNREELLAAIRKIVGRKFEFSETYTKNCGGYPTLGANEITYSILTRKYVYIPCRVTFGRNEEGEVGAYFHHYSLCKYSDGVDITKIEYEQLFTKDLRKIYNDLLFYLWWEKSVRLPKIEKEYVECKKYANIFDKIGISEEDMKKNRKSLIFIFGFQIDFLYLCKNRKTAQSE